MKTLILILGTIVLITFANVAAQEVVIKKAPLKYQSVKTTDGGELYSNICAVCHGLNGEGDGPAAPAFAKPVADLTILSAKNGGAYPHNDIEKAITGKGRVIAHGTLEMPIWGDQLLALRPDWTMLQRRAFTEKRINNLTEYIESMQVE